ncbi:MAG: hypothetical protein ABI548_23375 [Polyangiaceae bacterium]
MLAGSPAPTNREHWSGFRAAAELPPSAEHERTDVRNHKLLRLAGLDPRYAAPRKAFEVDLFPVPGVHVARAHAAHDARRNGHHPQLKVDGSAGHELHELSVRQNGALALGDVGGARQFGTHDGIFGNEPVAPGAIEHAFHDAPNVNERLALAPPLAYSGLEHFADMRGLYRVERHRPEHGQHVHTEPTFLVRPRLHAFDLAPFDVVRGEFRNGLFAPGFDGYLGQGRTRRIADVFGG